MKKTYEYFVTVKGNNGKFYLECICGRNETHANNVLNKLIKTNPDKEYRLEKDEVEECWWNTIGTH